MCLKDYLIKDSACLRDVLTIIDLYAVDQVLVIDDNDRLLGHITERDLRRALLGGTSLDAPARQLRRETVVRARPSTGRAEVVDLMQALGARQVPVVDDTGKLVGLHLDQRVLGVPKCPNWAVIMAGGKGTRLGPLTKDIPKPMLPVAGRPILERLVLHLVGAGIERIFLSVNYLANAIEKHFEDGAHFGCTIEYLREDPDLPLGTAGSLGLLADLGYSPDEPLLVMNGDLITQFSVQGMLVAHRELGAAMTMATSDYCHEVPFGVIEAEEQRLVRIDEKPVHRWPVNAGIYVIEPYLLGRIPKNGDFPITKLIADCIAREEKIGLWSMTENWQDIGRPEELAHARGEH